MSKRSLVVGVLMLSAVGLLAPAAGAKPGGGGGGGGGGKQPPLMSIQPASGDESTGTIVFQLTRTGKGLKSATVQFQTVAGSGTAEETADEDYASTIQSVTFSGRTTTATAAVNVTKDAATEDNETFSAELVNPSAGSAIGTGTATGTIIDDDQPGSWTLNPGDSMQITDISLAACNFLQLDLYEDPPGGPISNVLSKGTECTEVTTPVHIYNNAGESAQTVMFGLTDQSCIGGFTPQTFFSNSTSQATGSTDSWDFAAVSQPEIGVYRVRIMDAGNCFYNGNRRPGDNEVDTGNAAATVVVVPAP